MNEYKRHFQVYHNLHADSNDVIQKAHHFILSFIATFAILSASLIIINNFLGKDEYICCLSFKSKSLIAERYCSSNAFKVIPSKQSS